MLRKRVLVLALGFGFAVALLAGTMQLTGGSSQGASLSALLSAPVAHADQTGANDLAHFCQFLDQTGELKAEGINVGTCVNILKGSPSPQANNFISAFCAVPIIQAERGVSNRGQCIQIVRMMLS